MNEPIHLAERTIICTSTITGELADSADSETEETSLLQRTGISASSYADTVRMVMMRALKMVMMSLSRVFLWMMVKLRRLKETLLQMTMLDPLTMIYPHRHRQRKNEDKDGTG